MIPGQSFNIEVVETVPQPSYTYRLDLNKKRINNMIDGQQAVEQAVIKILNTERYSEVIYSSQYGVELERLIGKDYGFIYSDIARTLTEALTVDERILGVTDFHIERTSTDTVQISFRIDSIFGSTTIDYGVRIL